MLGWHVELYKEAIEEWAKSFRQKSQEDFNYKKFHQKIHQCLTFYISYDVNIRKAIIILLKEPKYQSFDLVQFNNSERLKIFKIAEYLGEKGMIGKGDILKINNLREKCYLHSIEMFFEQIQWVRGDIRSKDFHMKWEEMVQIDFNAFWQWANNHKIRHDILKKVYQVSTQLQSQDQIINNRYRGVIKKPTKQYIRKANISHKVSQQDKTLIQIATQFSLFMNPDLMYLLQRINQFKQYLSQLLFEKDDERYLQFFGSLANRLALINSFDIDLNVSYKKTQWIYADQSAKKQRQIEELQDFKDRLQSETIKWYKNLYIQKKCLPISLLKITLDKQQFRLKFQLEQVSKVDITIQNKKAMDNSRLIASYMQNKEILIFCIIVKLWAKRNHVINQRFPMAGLTSYAVVLMSLYYLMVTQQIQYLKPQIILSEEKHGPQNILYSQNLLSPYTNLRNFLLFFSKHGKFIRQRLMVCLIHPSQCDCGQFYDENLMFNIYDCISKCNKGRLRKEYSQLIFSKLDESLLALQKPNGISDLFQVTWASHEKHETSII